MSKQTLQQALAEQRLMLFGHPYTANDFTNAPLISPPRAIVITLPHDVWSDEALQVKIDQGATLDELLDFLHRNIHDHFVQAFMHQSHAQAQGDRAGFLTDGAGRLRPQPADKTKENCKGG
jgi:hypothetical protein